MISLDLPSQDNSQDYKGRKIIDAGGADGEGYWSGKTASLLAHMQHDYSQETRKKKKRIAKNNQKLRNSLPHFHIRIYVTYLFTRNTEKQYTKI